MTSLEVLNLNTTNYEIPKSALRIIKSCVCCYNISSQIRNYKIPGFWCSILDYFVLKLTDATDTKSTCTATI